MSDLTIYRGGTRSFALTLSQDGAPLDLTGKTVRYTARRTFGDAVAVIAKSTGAGIVHDPDQVANRGKATLTLVPADTTPLPNRRQVLRWDVQVEQGTDRFEPLEGRLEILPEVTTG